jgi:3-oxoacyl-[acyl-carrier-protein] synthase-1
MKGKSPVVVSYGCTSSAGRGASALFETLSRGEDRSAQVSTKDWPVDPLFQPRVCRWNREEDFVHPQRTGRAILGSELLLAWREAREQIAPATEVRLKNAKLGVILASTKSFVDDFIWTCGDKELEQDAMAPLLKDFLALSGLKPQRTLCVSNACASSLSAIFLATQWLKKGDVTDVWVIAADRIGPFVLQGFNSLHALTSERVRPFAQDRSGLQLGEGAAAILLSSSPERAGSCFIELQGAGIDTEGSSVTRPSIAGDSLKRACLQIEAIQDSPPEVIIAHGTATTLNDPAEDQAFYGLFGSGESSPVITASKWCIGHTLGASGALDLIVACEVLKRQRVFSIANTRDVDSQFQSRYLAQGSSFVLPEAISKVLVTSLGFGGVNAAAMVEMKRAYK